MTIVIICALWREMLLAWLLLSFASALVAARFIRNGSEWPESDDVGGRVRRAS